MKKIRVIVNIAIIIALYYLSYHIYNAVLNPLPPLGDSWDYHIPIARTIIDGSFLNPQNFSLPQWYYPGSSEIFSAVLILFKIPLSFSNIIATVVLFFALFKLGRVFGLEKYYSTLFSLSFVTLNVVTRWMNFALVDVWLSVFFVISIILLENPKKNVIYFLKLGFVVGMLLGTKYTAALLLIPLAAFYFNRVFRLINIKTFLSFMLPFSIFGLFWYFRNYLYTGNPFYPLTFLNFPSYELFAGYRVWNVFLTHPIQMMDSAFAEFKLWIFVVPFAIGFTIHKYLIKKNYKLDNVSKLFILGIINFILFLNFPTSEQSWIMVSSFRYLYPAIIPFMLGAFIIAKRFKKEEMFGYFVLGNMIFITSLDYYPKLTFIFIPLAFMTFYILKKKFR